MSRWDRFLFVWYGMWVGIAWQRTWPSEVPVPIAWLLAACVLVIIFVREFRKD